MTRRLVLLALLCLAASRPGLDIPARPALAEAPRGVSSPLPVTAFGMQPAPSREPAAAVPPAGNIGTALVAGTATWYCGAGSPCTRGYGPGDMVGAIDPTLGIPKGTWVTVRHGDRGVVVLIVDVCACKGARIIDLTRGAFSRLASPSRGVIPVELEVGAPALPATDTE